MYCDLWALSDRMRVGFEPIIVADALAIDSGVVVAAPKQKQTPATKPIAIDTMLSAAGKSLMSSNLKSAA